MSDPIYHLAPLSELRTQVKNGAYLPSRFDEDGFVHCSPTPRVTLAVARDYFADLAEPLVLLLINPTRLRSRLVYEAPAPIEGGGCRHLGMEVSFPHIYGSVNLDAIIGAAFLPRDRDGYIWPEGVFELIEIVGQS